EDDPRADHRDKCQETVLTEEACEHRSKKHKAAINEESGADAEPEHSIYMPVADVPALDERLAETGRGYCRGQKGDARGKRHETIFRRRQISRRDGEDTGSDDCGRKAVEPGP